MSLYVSLPALASLYGRLAIDTLHERVGEQEHLRGRQRPDDDENFNGTWARLVFLNGERDGGEGGVFHRDGPEFDYELRAFQAGVDLYRREHDNGVRDHAGVYGVIGQAEGEAHHFDGRIAGTNQIDAYSIGAYWTRYGRKGGYLDGVAQFSWYDAVARSTRFPAMEGDSQAFAASVEGGKPFRFGAEWIVEPQGQLIYQHFFDAEGTDAGGRVQFESTDSLVGRLGVRVARTWEHHSQEGEERLSTVWGRANIWHEFMDRPEIVFETEDGPVGFTASTGTTWWELNGGFDTQLSRRGVAYLNGSYLWDTDGGGHAVSIKVGVRFNW